MQDHALVDPERRYEDELLAKVTRGVEQRLAARVPPGYHLWRTLASMLGGSVYGFVLARVIANPEIWSGLAAIVGPVVLSISWWRTGQGERQVRSLDTALGSTFTAVSFIVVTFAMEAGYISGLVDQTSAYKRLRAEVSVIEGRIDGLRDEVKEDLDSVRTEKNGYRTGFLYMGERTEGGVGILASSGDILVFQALFDIPKEFDKCQVALMTEQEGKDTKRSVGWTDGRIDFSYQVEKTGEVRFLLELLDCRLQPNQVSLRPVVGYRVAWALRKLRSTPSIERALQSAERLELNTSVLGRTFHDWNQYRTSCNNGDGHEKIYELTLAEGTDVQLDLDANFDAVIAVLSVVTKDDRTKFYEVSCRRRFASGFERDDEFALSLAAGRYLIIVEGLDDASGSFGLSLTEFEPPPPLGSASPPGDSP